jgi:hypothetical protein
MRILQARVPPSYAVFIQASTGSLRSVAGFSWDCWALQSHENPADLLVVPELELLRRCLVDPNLGRVLLGLLCVITHGD